MKSLTLKKIFATAVIALPSALFAADADSDGLDDSVETNSGTYVSPANTGTKPNNPDSDGDGAGDWYEVATIDVAPTAAQPNAPNNAAIKPNIPYPLPAPDSTPPATNKPVKVYILSGQSNMVGQGNITPLGTAGTLETITKTEKKFPNLLNGTAWSVRNDVMYRGVIAATGDSALTPGYSNGTTTIGPEIGFGHVMGYHHDEPVLVIKSSEGGRALGWEFLPPGSVQYTVGSTIYAGYGDSPSSWATGTTPVPTAFYGGYQFDQCFRRKADWAPAGAVNPAVTNVTTVLDNFADDYPQWAAQGFVIAGFAWFHGWNDGLSYTSFYANRYEQNMAQFIRQIRAYYESRYPCLPKAPFVIATAAFEGWNEAYLNQYPTRRTVINAQHAVSDPLKYPEFAGNVKTMEARGYWRDKSIAPVPSGNQGYHYNRHAETFMLVGDALGRGMIDLLATPAGPDTTPPAVSAFNPADNATGVATNANLLLTFNEAIALGSGNITLKNLTDSAQTSIAITDATQVSLSGSVLTINPASNLAWSKSYAIRIDAGSVKDLANNAFPGIADDSTWNFTTAAAPVNGEITMVGTPVEGFLNQAKNGFATTHLGTTQISYDAKGADKLVVAIGTEAGNNAQKVNSVSLKFNGVDMALAAQDNAMTPGVGQIGAYDGGIAAIFHLDNPFQGPANFTFSASTTSGAPNGAHVTIIGLAGTKAGIGLTSASWATQAAAGNVSTNITTSAGNSLVIAMVENSGRNNGSGTAALASGSTMTLAHNGLWGGNQWGTCASAYQFAPSSGTTITPTFTTNAGGNIHVVTAEFVAVEIVASAYQTWSSQYPGTDLTDPSADIDGGGLPTGIEWVVGGNPTQGSDDAGLAPTPDITTDPDGKFRFTYRRRDAANQDPKTTIAVEYGGDLTGWAAAIHQGTGAEDITITEAPDDPGFSLVTVALPDTLADSGNLFVRLKVGVVTP